MEDFLSALRRTHDAVFETIQDSLDSWATGLFARFVFASVLMNFFVNSARAKLIDPTGQGGALDFLTVEPIAIRQIAPEAFKAAGGDTSQIDLLTWLVAYAGTYAEFLLPIFVVIGLFTRLSSIAMIGFIGVMTYVDVFGHGARFDLSKMFDGRANDNFVDQRLLWLFPLVYLVIRGAGLVSLDALFGRQGKRVSLA